jgi:hypothetical protein
MKLPKLKYWYHATSIETADKIVACGYLIPQAHKGDITAGVFFANTMRNAGSFCAMRGLKKYVVFKIPRDRFIRQNMFDNPADKSTDPDMFTMRYLDKVKVSVADATPVVDDRDFNLPGWEIVTNGTKQIAYKLVDLAAFEKYIHSNPELKAKIEMQLGHAID